MRIDGLVTCVGEKYAGYLSRSLPVWSDTLDSLTIVTSHTSFSPAILPVNCSFYETDLFTAYGAHFNKGLALSAAFGLLNPTDWVLNFDADILPEPDWRKKIEPILQVGNLHGCSRRYRDDGSCIPDSNFPDLWGFFHLWHVDDPHTWIRPVYPIDVGHAGNYDHTFQRQWEPENKIDLPIHLIHQGEPRGHWFGAENPRNEKYMNILYGLGLWEAWLTKAGHVKVPEFKHKIVIEPGCNEWIKPSLARHTTADPFEYRVRVGGIETVKPDEVFMSWSGVA